MLPVPQLDDRHFQEIVDEAKKRIPHYCEEWTDHNVSDPGVTMIELFAWMMDMVLYRVNQVPNLHYIKMLDMFGLKLQPPEPARAPVTFWLSAPQAKTVLLPAGTEIATTQTETEKAIVFTTESDFLVNPPKLEVVMSAVATQQAHQKQFINHNLRHLTKGGDEIEIYTAVPQVDDCLYFGFSEDLSHHILSLTLDFSSAGGAGIDPTLPPYVWEVAQGRQRDQWIRCDIDMDSTRGFNESGRVQIHLPQMNRRRLNEQTLYWVRARVKGISPLEQRQGMRSYQSTPRLKQAMVHARGGTVWARHMQTLTNELLGKSDGTPGQRFRTRMQPVLAREAGEVVRVELGGTPAGHWQEITDFAGADAADNHYTFDSVSGEIRFGPAIRQRDGMIRRFGAIPPRGANIILQRYRVGGGINGNVDTGAINTLKSGIPFVDRVLNREPARGGLDAETIEQAMMRAPSLIRSRDRAMSSDDFEFLTRQALPAKVGRVRALQARPGEDSNVPPGQVYVLIVPQANFPAGYLQADELSLTPEDLTTVHEYLDQRRLLTTRLNVRTPAYRWVSVNVQLGTMPSADEGAVEREVLARLYRFLNPLTGGMDGTGWPFGRNLFVADIYQALQNIPNVTFIRNVQLYAARPGGERVGEPVDSIDVVAHGVIVSGMHDVQFVQ